jgi:hypothetical protein
MCHRRFKCPPDLHDRQVRCPYCKTVVRIPVSSAAARQAVEAMGDLIAREKADREKRPLTGRAPAPRMMPVRNKNVAIVSLVLVAVGFIAAAVALVIVFGRGRPDGATDGPGILRISKRSPLQSSEPRPGPADPDATEGGGLAAAAPPPPMKPVPEAVTVKVERLIGGYKDETVTYAVGRVKNNTAGILRVIKIIISLSDKDDKDLGEATAIILNLPAGEAAPFVAEWQHAEGVIGRKWFPDYRLDPPGVPQELPAITAEDPVPMRDQNSMATTGWIRVLVTSQGALPVPSVMVHALLLGAGGKVVGAVRVQVDKDLPPKKQVEIRVPWTQCAGHLVHSTEVWVQPAI